MMKYTSNLANDSVLFSRAFPCGCVAVVKLDRSPDELIALHIILEDDPEEDTGTADFVIWPKDIQTLIEFFQQVQRSFDECVKLEDVEEAAGSCGIVD